MIKSILNIVLIFIICITALGIPLDLNMPKFSFDLPTIIKEDASYSTDIDSLPLNNPSQINFQIQTEDTKILSADSSDFSFFLDVIQNEKIISTLDASTLIKPVTPIKISSDVTNMKDFYLNLSKEALNLNDGDYTLKLYSTWEPLKDIEPLQLDVIYSRIFKFFKYVPATNEIPRGMMSLSLYYNAYDSQLVPITRFVGHNRTPLGTTIKELQNGSTLLNFSSPIPNVTKLRTKKGTVMVYLPKDLGKYNENPKDASFALESFVESLTSIKRINNVKFFVNGKESNTLFMNYDTKNLFSKNTNPKAYLGMNYNERLLLVPKNMEISPEDTLIKNIFATLKVDNINDKSSAKLIPTIPKNILLLNFSRNGNILTLNFSKEFSSAYENRVDLQNMMLDSILFSFTSIDGIEKVQILVDNQTINSFAGINLSEALIRPSFINPEKE